MVVLDGGPLNGPNETLVQSLWNAAETDTHGGYCVRDGDTLDRMDWTTVQSKVRNVASALMDAGVEPGDRVAILAETSRDWKIADHAIHAAGAVVVPIYPTLPADLVHHILADSGAKAIFVQDKEQAKKLPADHGLTSWAFETTRGFKKFSAIAKCAKPSRVDDCVAAGQLDDNALLIYTSGTTGVPKGVLLTHRNVAGDVCGAIQCLSLDQISDPKLVAFLPLAHIAGYVSLGAMTGIHARVLFSRPDRMATDLAWFHPTIALAVPRLWERIVRKVEEAVAEGSPIKQALFARAKAVAMEAGQQMEDGGRITGMLAFKHAFYDRLIYSKLREKLGFDKLRAGITGAAAVRADLLWFLQGIGLPIVEGYGMTESSALSVATRFDDWRAGTVGTPLPGHKIRLDADGEILIGGVGVFKEYWNLPEETASTRVMIDGEPWIRSGDIGDIDDDGNLRIVDRKKELEILDTGKMIAPVRVEELLKAETSLVEDSCLVANGQKFAVMLIQPAYDALLAAAAKLGVTVEEGQIVRKPAPTGEMQTYSVDDDVLQHPKIRTLFDDALRRLNQRVADYERVRMFDLVPHAFTIDRDELTPSFKKRRRDIVAHYKDRLDRMFNGPKPGAEETAPVLAA